MKLNFSYILIFFVAFSINAQETLSDVLKTHNQGSVPYISVQELAMPKTEAIIFDAREVSEYNVSHLKNAIFVGYDNFDIKTVLETIKDKGKKIVVYCSLGVRSEDIAELLKKAGYTNVFNLYGGIFEWKNKGFPVFDLNEKETEKVHAFSKAWSKWLVKGEKVNEKGNQELRIKN